MTDDISRLIEALEGRPQIPISVDLWSVREIAAYLKRSQTAVRDRITKQTTFPQPIRLPSEKGRGQPLWRASEVIAWAERFRDVA